MKQDSDICSKCKWFVYIEPDLYGCIGLRPPRITLFPIWFVRKDRTTCKYFKEKEEENEGQ